MRNCYKPGSNRKLFLILFMTIILALPGKMRADEVLKIYVADNFPPYSFSENLRPRGIYVNLIKEVFGRIEGIDVDIEALPPIRAMEYVKSGVGFAMLPFHDKPEIRQNYSNTLLIERIITVCKDDVFDKNNRKSWPQDYQGLTVGFRRGDEGNILKGMKRSYRQGIHIARTDRIESNIRKLLSGRIDCYVTESLSFLFELRLLRRDSLYHRNLAAPFTKGTDVISREARILFRSGREKDQALIERINHIISDMHQSGYIDDIVAGYLRG